MRTKVFLTIDTEFSIGGAFQSPRSLSPIGAQNVDWILQERSEGLGFLIDTFAAYNVRATFFVETLQTAYFGDGPMGEIARRIHEAGHDPQLHLHPVWTYFDTPNWQERLASEKPCDNLHGRTVDQLTAWMQRGIDTFRKWHLPAPVALRTGNLMVDRNVYIAMAQVGLKVASNVARAVFEPTEPDLRFNSGIHRVEGVIELPVLTYADLRIGPRTHRKLLTVTGSSASEVQCLLEHAHTQQAGSVVLLTHCHEFVKSNRRGLTVVDKVNQRRLSEICRYLHEHDDRFDVITINRMTSVPDDAPLNTNPLLSVPIPLAARRMVENKLNELNVI